MRYIENHCADEVLEMSITFEPVASSDDDLYEATADAAVKKAPGETKGSTEDEDD